MEAIRERLKLIIADQCALPAESIDSRTEFARIQGFDELDFVELVMEIEKAFNITIKDEDAELVETVGELEGQVQHLLNPSSGRPISDVKSGRSGSRLKSISGCVNVSVWAVALNVALLITTGSIALVQQFAIPLVAAIFAVGSVALGLVFEGSIRNYLRSLYMPGKKTGPSITINVSGGQVGNLNFGKVVGNIQNNLTTDVAVGPAGDGQYRRAELLGELPAADAAAGPAGGASSTGRRCWGSRHARCRRLTRRCDADDLSRRSRVIVRHEEPSRASGVMSLNRLAG